MNKDRKTKLLNMLKEGGSKEIPFNKTKASLLKAGFSEQEISHALYEHTYDGKKNTVRPEGEATKAFRVNSALAEKIGTHILEDTKARERTEAVVTGAASRFAPGRHAQSKYSFDLFEKLGIPFFRTFFAVIIIHVLVIRFNLPFVISRIVLVIIGLWIVWAYYRLYFKK